ncbi:MAG: hypothetical protein Ct9H300mP12_05760 [Acidimicrobiales bacterium]|nr:MAG: hypothetical protein Ct9H300mP12_05760 [Acidimicrobiales bacterium]
MLRSLQDLALAYLARDGQSIPFWRMATTPVDELRTRAERIAPELAADTVAVPGGGTLPGVEIPSAGLVLAGDRVAELRAGTPPLVARVGDDATVLDLRTVHPDDDGIVAQPSPGLYLPPHPQALQHTTRLDGCKSSPQPATSTTASRLSSRP